MFEFTLPWVFILLPLPLIARRVLPDSTEMHQSSLQVPFYESLSSLNKQSNLKQSAKTNWFTFIIWSLLICAAAKPQWYGEPISQAISGRDIMLAVDVSGSMETPDMKINNKPADRLMAIKHVLKSFIPKRKGDRLGLILFGSQAYLQTPLTFDHITLNTLLNETRIGIAGMNTAIGDAIGLAIKRLHEGNQKEQILILLTDGQNTSGEITPLQAAQLAAEEGLVIYTVGIGAEQMRTQGILGTGLGSRLINPSKDLDEKTLTAIANLTQGRYFRARNTEELNGIYTLIDQLEPIESGAEVFRPEHSLYYWPLGLALLLSILLAIYTLELSTLFANTESPRSGSTPSAKNGGN